MTFSWLWLLITIAIVLAYFFGKIWWASYSRTLEKTREALTKTVMVQLKVEGLSISTPEGKERFKTLYATAHIRSSAISVETAKKGENKLYKAMIFWSIVAAVGFDVTSNYLSSLSVAFRSSEISACMATRSCGLSDALNYVSQRNNIEHWAEVSMILAVISGLVCISIAGAYLQVLVENARKKKRQKKRGIET